jgi:hypothetical protein
MIMKLKEEARAHGGSRAREKKKCVPEEDFGKCLDIRTQDAKLHASVI